MGFRALLWPVSIPRSGFCGVGLARRRRRLGARAFQSLGRDSVGWDSSGLPQQGTGFGVSIPRSGFCGVGPKAVADNGTVSLNVSIPRSGFCGVGQ